MWETLKFSRYNRKYRGDRSWPGITCCCTINCCSGWWLCPRNSSSERFRLRQGRLATSSVQVGQPCCLNETKVVAKRLTGYLRTRLSAVLVSLLGMVIGVSPILVSVYPTTFILSFFDALECHRKCGQKVIWILQRCSAFCRVNQYLHNNNRLRNVVSALFSVIKR